MPERAFEYEHRTSESNSCSGSKLHKDTLEQVLSYSDRGVVFISHFSSLFLARNHGKRNCYSPRGHHVEDGLDTAQRLLVSYIGNSFGFVIQDAAPTYPSFPRTTTIAFPNIGNLSVTATSHRPFLSPA